MKDAFEKIKERLEKVLGDSNFEKATQEVNESFYEGLAYAYGEALSIVSEVKSEFNNWWIPCSERMPRDFQSVLCYAKSLARSPDTMFVGSQKHGFWFLQSSIGTESFPTQYEVVAWMPLPEPYKGE